MSLRMAFDFYGDQQVDRTLARIQHNVEDVSPAWERIADRFGALEARQFSSQGGHASGGWAALSPAYAAWKASHYPGAGILVRTGALRDSLTSRPFGVEEIGPKDMAIGSDVPYGRYHQAGTDRMPQRRPVEFTEHARRDWVKILQEHILAKGATAGVSS